MSSIPKFTTIMLTAEAVSALSIMMSTATEAAEAAVRAEQERLKKERFNRDKNRAVNLAQSLQGENQRVKNRLNSLRLSDIDRNLSNDKTIQELEKKSQNVQQQIQLDDIISELNGISRSLRQLENTCRRKEHVFVEIEKTQEEFKKRPQFDGSHFTPILETTLVSVRNAKFEDLESVEILWKKNKSAVDSVLALYDMRQRHGELSRRLEAHRNLAMEVDQKGFYDVNQTLEQADKCLLSKNVLSSRQAMRRAEETFDSFEIKFTDAAKIWQKQKEECEALLRNLSAQFNQTKELSSAETFSLLNLQMQLQETKLKELNQRLERHEFSPIFNQADLLSQELNSIQISAQRLEQMEQVKRSLYENIAPEMARRFDSSGVDKLHRMYESIRKAVINRMNIDFAAALMQFRTEVQAFFVKLSPQLKQWTIRQKETQNLINARRDYIQALQNSADMKLWAAADLQEQMDVLNEQEHLCNAGQFESVQNTLTRQEQILSGINAAVQEMRNKEARREYIVNAFQTRLKELGFSISQSSLENAGNPASATILTAVKAAAGKTINVRLPQKENEPVMYALDGYPFTTAKSGGKPVKSCDQAQRQLEQLHDVLKQAGIIAGKLRWEDQPPVDIQKEAMELPVDASRAKSAE